ncbi:MAG: hypothetical protein R2806_05570 [Saprospiraceae bacterium]
MRSWLVLIGMLFASIAAAQSDIRQAVLDAAGHQQWDKAMLLASKWIDTDSSSAEAYFYRGLALVRTGQYAAAGAPFLKARSLHYPVPNAIDFNLAKVAAQTGDPDQAITLLQKLADRGFGSPGLLNDPAFAPLQDRKEFPSIRNQVEANKFPCLADPKFRQFDFWIGDWDVYMNGQLAGYNTITRAEGGCALHENWHSADGSHSGQSINYYDPVRQAWHQNWVGSGMDITDYVAEESREGYLRFVGKMKTSQGIVLKRMTFTYDPSNHSVLQFIEDSTDEGKTWTAGFRGLYIPHGSTPPGS